MATLVGADLPALQSLEAAFRRESEAVDALRSRIHAQVVGSEALWVGPAAQQFRDRWQEQFVRALAELTEALRGNADVVRARHDAIERATGV
jgi:uncharacterized protein YukE